MSQQWWSDGTVYQIYPRSFADANGDGIGDLAGIRDHIDHLVELEVDAVWLSPFYPSGFVDGGYDVIDLRDVDPVFGTLDDLDDLIADLHAHGIKVIIDIVANHTSDRHPWFREALASGPGSPARQRYHFHDGDEPPSDWVSIFGGLTWTQVPDGQWYYHSFAPEQPDLNWDNSEVQQEFLDILRFWADRGVDGFRVDAASLLAKDLHEPLPSKADLDAWPIGEDHPLQDRDATIEIFHSWRRLLDSFDPPRAAVAEATVPAARLPRYTDPSSLGQAFFFDLLSAEYDAEVFADVIDRCITAASGSSVTWVLNNHDTVRSASRYGTVYPGLGENGWPIRKYGGDWLQAGGDPAMCDAAQGLRRARAAALVMLALPGSAYLYQGEELGLQEVAEIPVDQRQDPTFFRRGDEEVGRDGCRVPLPWEPIGPSYGFGPAGPHLPQPLWFSHYAVSTQRNDPASTLTMYRDALRLRKELIGNDDLIWTSHGENDVLAFRRGKWLIVSNFGDGPSPLPGGTVELASGIVTDELPGETTVWVRR